MATHHAVPGEIVDLGTWAQDVSNEKAKVILFFRQVKNLQITKYQGPV